MRGGDPQVHLKVRRIEGFISPPFKLILVDSGIIYDVTTL
jgi:hypothetical protein